MEFADFFFHEHPLMLTDLRDDVTLCEACGEFLEGQAYACGECFFNIHKSCAELPQEFQNPYHPHPLTLVTHKSDARCIACLEKILKFSFHCVKCNFYLDTRCALWKPATDGGRDELQHLTHFHPLVATEKKKQDDGDGDGDGDDSCIICGKPCFDALYGCDDCSFYLHRSCANWRPRTLQHFYHPCLLTLCLDQTKFICKACGNYCDLCPYVCDPCNFRIEISCARLPMIMESLGQQQIHHFSHGHPLKLSEIEHDDRILCSACQKICSGQTYVCCIHKCMFFLHESCFDLPRTIHHQFHPHHPLNLYSPIQRHSTPKCKVCYRSCSGFTYSCHCCEFHMDAECPLMISTIKYQGHHHNIVFVDGQDPCQTDADYHFAEENRLCSACGSSCNHSIAMFHCAQCNFHLHFKCGPLPYFVKHEDHPCPLRLTDSPVIIEGEDKDTDMFYCDACEKERNPRLPVYYCSNGCAFLVEIKCLISEVLFSLGGGHGEVELRSAIFKHKAGRLICKGAVNCLVNTVDNDIEQGKPQVNRVLTIIQIWIALSPEEQREVGNAFACALNNNQDHEWSADKRDLSSPDEEYIKFMSSMNTADGMTMLAELKRYRKKFINVGNYWMISDLIPILDDLCAKYEDIIPKSIFQNSWVGTIFVNLLCETIRGMCTIRVLDISEEELFSWWRNLNTLKHLGFRVELALDRLKRVVHAYYALRVEKMVKEDCGQIDREIKELEAKLMELKEKRKRMEQPRSASSSILAECFKEVSELKWMKAGEGLL